MKMQSDWKDDIKKMEFDYSPEQWTEMQSMLKGTASPWIWPKAYIVSAAFVLGLASALYFSSVSKQNSEEKQPTQVENSTHLESKLKTEKRVEENEAFSGADTDKQTSSIIESQSSLNSELTETQKTSDQSFVSEADSYAKHQKALQENTDSLHSLNADTVREGGNEPTAITSDLLQEDNEAASTKIAASVSSKAKEAELDRSSEKLPPHNTLLGEEASREIKALDPLSSRFKGQPFENREPSLPDTMVIYTPAVASHKTGWSLYANVEHIFDGHENHGLGHYSPNYISLGAKYRMRHNMNLIFGVSRYLGFRRLGTSTIGGMYSGIDMDYDYELNDNPSEYITSLTMGFQHFLGQRFYYSLLLDLEQSRLNSAIVFNEYLNTMPIRMEVYVKDFDPNIYIRLGIMTGYEFIQNDTFSASLYLRYSKATNSGSYKFNGIDPAIDQFEFPSYWGSFEENLFNTWKDRQQYALDKTKNYSLSFGVNMNYHF